MDKQFSKMEWFELATQNYDAITKEIENGNPLFLSQQYPKFVVMYEYFRLLRGEAFIDHRGPVTSEEQRRLYEMEHEIAEKLKSVRKRLDIQDSAAKYYIEEMKKQFDI